MLNPDRVAALVDIVERLKYLPLADRVDAFIQEVKAAGAAGDAYAMPATFLALAAGSSTTVQNYTLQTQKADGHLLVVGIQHPSPGVANIIATSGQLSTHPFVDDDALMDSWCDDERAAQIESDVRGLPWPLVLRPGSTLELGVTGTGLNIVGLQVRGYIVDEATAQAFIEAGMFFCEGFNVLQAAAAVMSTPMLPRQIVTEKEVTHVVATETLTGDAVRSNVNLVFKGVKLIPRQTNGGGACIPPLRYHKPGARVSIGLSPNDTVELEPRYTSAATTGTANLQITALGRRRYNC